MSPLMGVIHMCSCMSVVVNDFESFSNLLCYTTLCFNLSKLLEKVVYKQ